MRLKFWDKLTWTSEPPKIVSDIESLVRNGLHKSYSQFNKFIETMAHCLEKLNMDLDTAIVTLEAIQEACTFLKGQKDIIRTPTLQHVQSLFPQLDHSSDVKQGPQDAVPSGKPLNIDLYIKLENMQTTGSFKIRGVLNQLHKVLEKHGQQAKLVTISAGNYGKAFAHVLRNTKVKAICVMPYSAPQNRVIQIEKLGVEVRRTATNQLQAEVDRLVSEENYVFCHSFDDVDLIAGYACSAVELLEDVPDPDVVVVCCGGGGLVSGVGAGISLSGHKQCRVYAVEPEGAPTMFESFKERRPVTLSEVKTVAAGLAPPYAGTITYRHCRWFVEDILLVSDEEILQTMRLLFHRGIIAEPSGCAALAAVLSGKVPNIGGKKVVVYISGGNVSCAELQKLIPEDQ